MKGSKRVLVKVVVFQLRVSGQPQHDAMPNFFTDSRSFIFGLSNASEFP